MKLLTQSFIRVVILSVTLWALLSSPAAAYESFTATVSFYQGVNVATGQTEIDETVLTLVFGASGDVELVLTPDIDNPFQFSNATDFYFETDPTAGASISFTPSDNIVAMAVVQDPLLDNFDNLFTTPFSTSIAPDDIIVLKINEDTYFKISDITRLQDLQLSITTQQIAPGSPNVPEPTTLLLLGAGILGLIGIARRKR